MEPSHEYRIEHRVEFKPRILIFTEGKCESVLLKTIQRVYQTSFSIRQGNGSTPEVILNNCLSEDGDFDVRYCVLDGDKIARREDFDKIVNEKKKGLNHELILVINEPCIEAINLALFFGDTSGFERKNCGRLKEKFKKLLNNTPLEDFYDEKLSKKLINSNKHLFANTEFKILLELFCLNFE